MGSLSLPQGSSQPRDQTQVSHTAGSLYQLSYKGSPKSPQVITNRSKVITLLMLVCVCVCVCVPVCARSLCIWLFVTPWAAATSMRLSRQEYMRWLLFSIPDYLPYPQIQPRSLVSPALAERFFTLCHLGGTLLMLKFISVT